MNIEPLFQLPVAIQIHVLSAMIAFVLGPVALWRKRRDSLHKITGYAWVSSMATVAVSSFWISGFQVFGPFSPIHGLSVFVLWSLFDSVRLARRGNIAGHKEAMQSLYLWAVCITGLLTLVPDRFLGKYVFGTTRDFGLAAILATIAILLLSYYGTRVLPLGKVKRLFY